MSDPTIVDQQTLDVIKNMGVEVIDTKQPTKIMAPEIIAPEAIPAEPEAEPKKQYTPEEIQKFIDEELKAKAAEQPAVNPEEQSFADILKELEATSKDSSDAGNKVTETQQKLDEKVKELDKGDGTSETVKEIVQLNAKLQIELEEYKDKDELNKKKIKELSEKVNYYELDDARMQVPDDIKIPLKHYLNFVESKNDAFKFKALEGFITFIEKLGGIPIGPYIDDVASKELKAVASLSKDEPPQATPQPKPEKSALDQFAEAHGIPKGL